MKAKVRQSLTFILLMWTFGRSPNNASKWQMGFNSVAMHVLKGLQEGGGAELRSFLTSVLSVNDQHHAPVALPPPTPGVETIVPIEQQAVWAPQPLWALVIGHTGIRTPDRPAISSVTKPTELSRYLCHTK